MVTPELTSSRARARWAHTFTGVMYGSLAWPVFAVAVFLAVSVWTERPGWKPPQMEWPQRSRRDRRIPR